MEYTHTVKKYTVLLTTEEIIECDNLKVLYDEIRRRIRWSDEKFTFQNFFSCQQYGVLFNSMNIFHINLLSNMRVITHPRPQLPYLHAHPASCR